jgi:hypothetical protein
MKLKKINKSRYRRHLNRLIIACIVILIVGSLGISQTLIALFPDESGSHFHWNLLGVVITSLSLVFLLNQYRRHAFMTEVVYVWELKQALNKINRKMLKLKAASETGDIQAMTAIGYSFAGSRQLWQLDDNNIVVDELAVQQAQLDSLAVKYNVTLDVENYDDSILKQF